MLSYEISYVKIDLVKSLVTNFESKHSQQVWKQFGKPLERVDVSVTRFHCLKEIRGQIRYVPLISRTV